MPPSRLPGIFFRMSHKNTEKSTQASFGNRNLKLAEFGLEPAEELQSGLQLTPHDEKILEDMANETTVKSQNHNYVIDPRKLTIKNLPKFCDNGELSRVLQAALGKDLGMSLEKCLVIYSKDSSDLVSVPNSDRKVRKCEGFAFVSFRSHESAMRALRQLSFRVLEFYGSYNRRVFAQFAFDDVRKLQILKGRQTIIEKKKAERMKESQVSAKSDSKPDGSNRHGSTDKKHMVQEPIRKNRTYSRGQRQREKRRQARLKSQGSEGASNS